MSQSIPLPPMITTGNVWLAAQAILAVDLSGYTADAEREIIVFIVGPHEIELKGEDADAFKRWWNDITGQNRVQPAPPGLKIT